MLEKQQALDLLAHESTGGAAPPKVAKRRPGARVTESAIAVRAPGPSGPGYEETAREVWRHGQVDRNGGAALRRERVRYATLAPSSHNTRCWKFAIEDKAITVAPDRSGRGPAVDPDDHHLFVSLGSALDIRNAHLNQPVEVASLRPRLANLLGLPGQRPDLVIRFERGPTLPPSLPQPVSSVLA